MIDKKRILISAWKNKTYYACDLLNKRGYLSTIICNNVNSFIHQFQGKFRIPSSKIVSFNNFYRVIVKILSINQKILGRKTTRYYYEMMFDHFVSSHINGNTQTLFCDLPSALNSVKKAKKFNILTIVQEQMAHPIVASNLIREECKRFNIKYKTEFMNDKLLKRRIEVLKHSDGILAVSSSVTARSLKKCGISSKKIQIVSSGVDLNYFKPSDKSDHLFRVLLIGNGSLIKGVPYLIQAWQQLSLKDAELVICGVQNNKLLSNFRKSIDFITPGIVTPLDYYLKASIFVLPSIIDGFPRVVLEAMASGLPVIISNGVGAMDVVTDGKEGFIVPIRDPDALADRIYFFYKNRDEIKRMGILARKTAEKYSWEKYGENIVKAIEYFH